MIHNFYRLDKRIDYYGDPLRDFGLPHFLERFSFKNPKKLDQEKTSSTPGHKNYVSYGPRGMPVKSLTRNNCTEEEMFIFNYLEQKRKQAVVPKTKGEDDEGGEEDLKAGEVDDDEFEEYLDGFFGGKKGSKGEAEEADDEELDFLKEFEGALAGDSKKSKGKSKKKAGSDDEDNMDDIDADWGDDDDIDKGSDLTDDEDASIDFNQPEDDEDDDDESISMDEMPDNDDSEDEPDFSGSESDLDDDDDDEDEPKRKKSKKDALATTVDERSFAKKLKHSDGMFLNQYFISFYNK